MKDCTIEIAGWEIEVVEIGERPNRGWDPFVDVQSENYKRCTSRRAENHNYIVLVSHLHVSLLVLLPLIYPFRIPLIGMHEFGGIDRWFSVACSSFLCSKSWIQLFFDFLDVVQQWFLSRSEFLIMWKENLLVVFTHCLSRHYSLSAWKRSRSSPSVNY